MTEIDQSGSENLCFCICRYFCHPLAQYANAKILAFWLVSEAKSCNLIGGIFWLPNFFFYSIKKIRVCFIILPAPPFSFTPSLVRLPHYHYAHCASSLPAPLRLYDFLVRLPCLQGFPCATSLLLSFPWCVFLSSTIMYVFYVFFASPFSFCVLLVLSGALSFPVLSIGCVLTFPFFFHRFWVFCAFVIWACLLIRLIVADYHLCKLDTLSIIIHLIGIIPWIIWIGILTQWSSAHYQLCKLDNYSMHLELSLSWFESAYFLNVQRTTIYASWKFHF